MVMDNLGVGKGEVYSMASADDCSILPCTGLAQAAVPEGKLKHHPGTPLGSGCRIRPHSRAMAQPPVTPDSSQPVLCVLCGENQEGIFPSWSLLGSSAALQGTAGLRVSRAHPSCPASPAGPEPCPTAHGFLRNHNQFRDRTRSNGHKL